jgi:SPP1 gp7 family putative phage head morphogenesis protein
MTHSHHHEADDPAATAPAGQPHTPGANRRAPTAPDRLIANRHDPTQTTGLRKQYSRQFGKRWRYLKGLIWEGVAEQDRLGLRERREGREPGGTATDPASAQTAQAARERVAAHLGGDHGAREKRRSRVAQDEHDDSEDDGEDTGGGGGEDPDAGSTPNRPDPKPTPTAELPPEITERAAGFTFPDDEAKIRYFNQWIEQSHDDLLTTDQVPSQFWGGEYTAYAYEGGLEQAKEFLAEQGVSVPTADIGAAFNLPVHEQTLQGLYTRNYKGLEAITEEVGRQISDVLTEGFLEGVNPRVMARRMNERIDSVGIVRSRTLARTEVIRAHNEAALSRYERVLGSDAEVSLVAEFRTAGDSRVCEQCRDVDGKRFKIKDARNLIPLHPRCRCTYVPVTDAV